MLEKKTHNIKTNHGNLDVELAIEELFELLSDPECLCRLTWGILGINDKGCPLSRVSPFKWENISSSSYTGW